MKKILSLLLSAILLLSLAACTGIIEPTEVPPNGISEDQLNEGNSGDKIPPSGELELKEMEKFSYDENGNQTDRWYYYGSNESHTKYVYDASGNLTEYKTVTNGSEAERYIYSYENGVQTGETVYKNGEKIKVTVQTLNEKGQVVADSVWDKGVTTDGTYTYSETGNQVLAVFQSGGKETERYESKYDDQDRVIREAFFQEGKQVFATEYTYDENDNVTLEVQYSDDQVAYRHVYTYNEQGDMVEDAYYEADGKIIYRYLNEYSYYEGNRPKELKTYENLDPASTTGGVLVSVLNYSESGSLLTESTYEDGKLATKGSYVYDEKGNTVEEKYLWYRENGDCEENRTTYTYNANGQTTKETHYEAGEESYRDEYTFDANGNETEHCRYQLGVMISRYISVYDDSGNLIRTELHKTK